MRNILLLLGFNLFLLFSSFANTSNYYVNDENVDALFTNATETNLFSVFDKFDVDGVNLLNSSVEVNEEKSAVVATILCYFLGPLGVHRYYLGTTKKVFITYICTFGGLGCVYAVDFWVLLIDGMIGGNINDYINNNNFLMWTD
ncbi:MAG: hypothetical protein B6I24_08055 [Bacteroidetes bacterium 4572_128]|nr:MAG: hypothetical protein B6I24_08055 [Bacteroidetes bacterium 4572_128]